MDTSSLHHIPRNVGWIEVVCGCMFSGKTEELIRRLRRAQIARQERIVSHSEQSLVSTPVKDASDILALVGQAQVIGIDEGQFFGPNLVDVCERLANEGRRVIVAGLDQDFQGKPFEPMPQLLAVAEYITKTLAICVVCGNPADRTYRRSSSQERVVLGAKELYEARCRRCHQELPT